MKSRRDDTGRASLHAVLARRSASMAASWLMMDAQSIEY